MTTSTVPSIGQITLPQGVRQAPGLSVGDEVDFVEIEGGFKLLPRCEDVRALKGRFSGRVAEPVTLEAMDETMDETIVEAAAERGSE